jgi:hypothetical protein
VALGTVTINEREHGNPVQAVESIWWHGDRQAYRLIPSQQKLIAVEHDDHLACWRKDSRNRFDRWTLFDDPAWADQGYESELFIGQYVWLKLPDPFNCLRI